jgi:hypothetical protein
MFYTTYMNFAYICRGINIYHFLDEICIFEPPVIFRMEAADITGIGCSYHMSVLRMASRFGKIDEVLFGRAVRKMCVSNNRQA